MYQNFKIKKRRNKMQYIICIYDKNGKSHYEPKFTRNPAQLMRDFITVVNDETNQLNKFPEQFELRQIGTFDETTGILKSEIKTVVEAVNCIRHFVKNENSGAPENATKK